MDRDPSPSLFSPLKASGFEILPDGWRRIGRFIAINNREEAGRQIDRMMTRGGGGPMSLPQHIAIHRI